MNIQLTHVENAPIFHMEKFCKLTPGLTYVGRVVNKATNMILPVDIIEYDGKFYTTELDRDSRISAVAVEGMWRTTITLFEAYSYVPTEFEPLTNSHIIVDVWNIKIDDETPFLSYAFTANQLEEAKATVMRHEDVDIFMNRKKVEKADFLKL